MGEKHLGAKGRMSQYENAQRFLERHRRLGLCTWCNRKAKTGRVLCQVCQERISKRQMELHPLFCPECRKLIDPIERRGGRTFHKLCSEKRRARMYPLTHRRAAIAYQRRHRKMGLCTSCPRKVFKGGLCRKHYGKVLERYYERAAG